MLTHCRLVDFPETSDESCSIRGQSKAQILIPTINNKNIADARNYEMGARLAQFILVSWIDICYRRILLLR
jgi:hypothetical protein